MPVITIPALKDKHVLVVGLGKTGLSTIDALNASQAHIYVHDDLVQNTQYPFDGNDHTWSQIDLMVLSPGIPITHPLGIQAQRRAIPVVCDLDLLAQAYPLGKFFGVTGTNGKSTTTALLNHMLQALGLAPLMGGNIGVPVLTLEPFGEKPLFVLELSSYQLERVPHLQIHHGIWLNITPDHLERHGSMDGYLAAKKHMIAPYGVPQSLVIGIDDPYSLKLFQELVQDPSKALISVAVGRENPQGVSVMDGILAFQGQKMMDLKSHPVLKGSHNWQNIACVWALLRLEGLEFRPDAFLSFQGLAHRQEPCGVLNGVLFINDSKATNFESTRTALMAFDRIHLILGGKAKEGGIEEIESFQHRIISSYLIGDAAPAFAQYLEGQHMPYHLCQTLENALKDATAKAQPGDVVLLSPACASFDQFKNFEERGNLFKKWVQERITLDKRCL